MPSPTLRVGEPAVPGGPPLPIEGARLHLDGPLVQLLVGYHEPTASEVEAVESGEVELGVYHEEGIAAIVARAGERAGYWHVETCAPLILLNAAAHVDGLDDVSSTGSDTYPAELALCESEHRLVYALRRLRVPAPIICAARRAAHAQANRFQSVAAAVQAHELGLRYRTVREMMDLATARARIED